MALLNVAIYDATIAAWDSKYAHNRPRPSELDPSIAAVLPNPRSPSYPSEHAVVAAAASTVLSYLFPDSAQSYTAMAREAAQSRLDAGIQFPSDTDAGFELGRQVGLKVIARAQDDMNRARMLWQEYRSTGAIDASQRIETSISDQFRTRAHLLAEASRYAQQSFQIYSQVDAAAAAQWTGVRDEIESEAREQRSRLDSLSNVVEPGLLKTKLALLGDPNE